jgi:hypothetical protein
VPSGKTITLRSKKDNQGTAYTTVGLNAAKMFPDSDRMTTIVRSSLGWRHAFGELTPLRVSLLPTARLLSLRVYRLQAMLWSLLRPDVNIMKMATLGVYCNGQVLHNIAHNGVRT